MSDTESTNHIIPIGLEATAGDCEAILEWNKMENEVATGFEFRCSTDNDAGEWTSIPESSASTVSHVVKGLENGVRYQFQVRALWHPLTPQPQRAVRVVTVRLAKRPSSWVNFRDPNLRDRVDGELRLTRGAVVTRGDMARMTGLYIRDADIKHLDGLEYAINLRRVYFPQNSITDVSPLSQIDSLTDIDLADNRIVDVTPLAKIKGLQTLSLSKNDIDDFSVLTDLEQLRHINLSYNRRISDFTPIGSFASLKYVSLSGNVGLSELTPEIIRALDGLHEIVLSQNQIADITPLATLTNLVWVDLSENKFSDVSPLASLPKLYRINLDGTKVSDISPLAGLPRLRGLRVSRTAISDFSPLEGLESLRELTAYGCALADISKFAGLVRLTTLDLHGNAIVDVNGLQALTQLRTLDLSWNAIVDPSPLAELPALRHLYLSDNNIIDATALARLSGTVVNVSAIGNRIMNIEPLVGTKFKSLSISYNPLEFDGSARHILELCEAGTEVSCTVRVDGKHEDFTELALDAAA